MNGISFFGFTGGGIDIARTDLDDVTVRAIVPEPSTYLMVLGLAGLGLAKRRKRQ